MSVDSCPCCSYPLLRHIRPSGIYWYCLHCHQEMPNFSLGLELNAVAPLDLSFCRSRRLFAKAKNTQTEDISIPATA
jgi:hypothetical protein